MGKGINVLNGDSPTNQGCGYHFRTVLVLVPFIAVVVSMRQGIVAGLTGGTAHEIAQQMLAGLQLVLFFAVGLRRFEFD